MIYKKNRFTLYNTGLKLYDQFFVVDHEGTGVCGSNGMFTEYVHFFQDLDINHRIEIHDYREGEDSILYFLVIHNVYVECGDLVGLRSALITYLESAFPSLHKKYLKLESEE